jgi:hypothetical protein
VKLLARIRKRFRKRGATRVAFKPKGVVILPRVVAWDRASRVYGDTQ